MNLWGCVVSSDLPHEHIAEEGFAIDVLQGVLLSDKPCNVAITLHDDGTSPSAKKSASNDTTGKSIIARLTPKSPNVRLHLVIGQNVTFEVFGDKSVKHKVQLTGSNRDDGFQLKQEDLSLADAFRMRAMSGMVDDECESTDDDDDDPFDLGGGDDSEEEEKTDDDDLPANGTHPQIEEIDDEGGIDMSGSTGSSDTGEKVVGKKPSTQQVSSKKIHAHKTPAAIRVGNTAASKEPSLGNQLRLGEETVTQTAPTDGSSKATKRKMSSINKDVKQRDNVAGGTHTKDLTSIISSPKKLGSNVTAPAKKKVKIDESQPDNSSAPDKSLLNDKPFKDPSTRYADMIPNLGLKKQTKAGVGIEVISEGNGPIASVGMKVTVEYEGKCANKQKAFDKGKLTFRLGKGETIHGFDIGIRGMMCGECRRICIPSRMGYGSASMKLIPANSDLIFVVTLLSTK